MRFNEQLKQSDKLWINAMAYTSSFQLAQFYLRLNKVGGKAYVFVHLVFFYKNEGSS